MIGIVVPAHNEATHLAQCLSALMRAAAHHGLAGEAVAIAVVLDSCDDDSAQIARRFDVIALEIDARNVGRARAAGAAHLLAAGARWLAFTDADTVVSPPWLTAQLALGADAVCGSITVDDWSAHPAGVRECFERGYVDADGHRHIHGANFGVSANAYLRAGGFAPLVVSEDVALVRALQADGATIAWSAAPRVCTSARLDPRARGGFGDYLLALAPVATLFEPQAE